MTLKEFYYRGLPVGVFETENYPTEKGMYKYSPYLGVAHQEMLDALSKIKIARCYYDTSHGRLFFDVHECKENTWFEIDNFEWVKLTDKNLLKWLAPWIPAVAGLEKELTKEVGSGHVLYQLQCLSIGRRIDNDEVLFQIYNSSINYAVVHLTWLGKMEMDDSLPKVELFTTIEEWAELKMKTDHLAYMDF